MNARTTFFPGDGLPEVTAPIDNPEAAQRIFATLQQRAAQAGVDLRTPPPVPTTCCGRGCNGCVWEGWYGAAAYWRDEALLRLG